MNFDEKLIEEVKQHPALYQRSTGGYKNMAAKIRIWSAIANQLSSTDEICQNRWKCLRDRYGRESKKLNMSPDQQITEPAWPHWSRMEFLKDHIKPKITTVDSVADKSTEKGTTSKANVLLINTEPAQVPLENGTNESKWQSAPSAKKVRLNDDILPNLAETMECFKTYLTQKAEANSVSRETSQPAFYKAIGDIIDSLQPRNQIIARAHILQYLADLQLKELNTNESIKFFCG